MSWEWVTLILGVVLLIALLMAFVAWTQLLQTKMRMGYSKAYQNIPREKKEDASQEE